MQTVPKIVQKRLRATPMVGAHPDPDLLTAFAEQSLSPPERATVLEHVAGCGDCREIVALALPTPEAVSVKAAVPARGWMTWPALRWGLVAAGVVIIASFGLLQFQRSARPAQMSSYSAPRQQEIAKSQEAPAPAAVPERAAPEVATPAAKEGDKVEPTRTLSSEGKSRGSAALALPKRSVSIPAPPAATGANTFHGNAISGSIGGPLHSNLHHGPEMPNQLSNQWQQQNAVQLQAPAPAGVAQGAAVAHAAPAAQPPTARAANTAPPQASEAVEVQVQTDTVASNTETQALQPQRSAGGEQKEQFNYSSGAIEKTKPSDSPVNGRAFSQLTTLADARWTISPSGSLQRSLDQGRSWQDVDVSANSLAAANLATVAAEARQTKDTVDKKALKQPPAASGILFRAVSASGSEVWAGGSAGMLYHSQDAGMHWSRVIPSAAAVTLDGDVVSIEFSDTQHGKVTTSAAEVWTTSDNGQTWQRQ